MTDEELIEQVKTVLANASGGWLTDAEQDKIARAALAAINLPAQLEAARTQGWNEAIEAALAEVITDQTIDKHGAHCCCTTCELNVAEAGIRALTKDSTHD